MQNFNMDRMGKRFGRMGQNIADSVDEAVKTGDFSHLADDISREVNGAFRGENYGQRQEKKTNYFLVTQPKKGASSFKQALNTGAAVILGLIALNMFGALFLMDGVGAAIVDLVFVALFGFGAWRCGKRASREKRFRELVDRYYAYGKLLEGQEYFSVQQLAARSMEQPIRTQQNLIDMKKENFLPQATFDPKVTTVMLTDHARSLYQSAMQTYEERTRQQQEQKTRQTTAQKTEEKKESSKYSAEVQQVLDEGNAYIRKIRQINDEIPDTEIMSEKLYRLENIVRSIFEQVELHPEKAKDLRKVLSYYLPTTEKLLRAYVQSTKQSYQTDETRRTQNEIEVAVDTVCEAFEKLLARMTEVDAMDISSDISVMEQMMKQDGLADSDFSKAPL